MTSARILAGIALSLIAFFFAMVAMVHVVEFIGETVRSVGHLLGAPL